MTPTLFLAHFQDLLHQIILPLFSSPKGIINSIVQPVHEKGVVSKNRSNEPESAGDEPTSEDVGGVTSRWNEAASKNSEVEVDHQEKGQTENDQREELFEIQATEDHHEQVL